MSNSLRLAVIVLAGLWLLAVLRQASADDFKDLKFEAAKSGLKIADVVQPAEGEEARGGADGDIVEVQYTGWLTSDGVTKGKKFDSTHDHGKPFQVKLGKRRVIKGWDEGIPGMKVGGKRILVIPPELAYGKEAKGDEIPANSTLIFEIELLRIK
jgi:FKBP-type peptidyl-prolyl cis-trans isomerase